MYYVIVIDLEEDSEDGADSEDYDSDEVASDEEDSVFVRDNASPSEWDPDGTVSDFLTYFTSAFCIMCML